MEFGQVDQQGQPLTPGRPARRGRPRGPDPLDLLVLSLGALGGLAASLWLDRAFMENLRVFAIRHRPIGTLPGWMEELQLPAWRILYDFVGFLCVVSLGLAVVTLRVATRHRCWTWPGPGVAATFAAALGASHQILERLIAFNHEDTLSRGFLFSPVGTTGSNWSPFDDWGLPLTPLYVEAGATAAITGVWAILFLARAWRPRPDWRDWLGRWLGWCWLLLPAFQVLSLLVWGSEP